MKKSKTYISALEKLKKEGTISKVIYSNGTNFYTEYEKRQKEKQKARKEAERIEEERIDKIPVLLVNPQIKNMW